MKVKVELHDGKNYIQDIQEFDLSEFIGEVNKDPYQMIQFGSKGLTKNTIKTIETNYVEEITQGKTPEEPPVE